MSYLFATASLLMSDITLNVYVGVIMTLCILTEGAVAMTVAVHLFGPDIFQLSAYLEPYSLMHHAAEHVFVCILSFAEPRLLVFLPWKTSEFSKRSNGFPSLNVFKAIIYVKSCCSMLRVAILIVAHKSTNSTRVSLCFSILVLIFSISEGLLKLKSEKIQQYDSAIVSKAALCEMHEKADTGGGDDAVSLEKSSEEYEQTIARLQLEMEELRMANRRNSVREDDVEDLEKAYVAKTEFPDENLGVVRAQLLDLGKSPLEYIPLEKIEKELAELTNKVNSGKSFDERRLDHLLACMERNPEYLAKIEVKQREEREKLAPILKQHLATMREFIPPNIFDCKMTTLQEDYGYSKVLAKRLISKKCLRVVRMRPEDIMKLHEVELTGQYGHGGQMLDVVEKTALLAAFPKHFENDGRGVKKKYLLDLEENVKSMIREAEAGSLSKQLLRHSAYTNQVGIFGANTEMHCPDVTSGEDAFNPRTSYKLSSPRSTDISLTEESVLLGQSESVDGSDFSPDPSPASRKGSSSVGIGSNEFLKRSSSLEQMFRRKSSLTKSNEQEIKCAGIGRNEFTKRSSSVEALLSKKSLSFSPNGKDSKISDKNEKSLAELHQDSRLVLVATDDEDESVLL